METELLKEVIEQIEKKDAALQGLKAAEEAAAKAAAAATAPARDALRKAQEELDKAAAAATAGWEKPPQLLVPDKDSRTSLQAAWAKAKIPKDCSSLGWLGSWLNPANHFLNDYLVSHQDLITALADPRIGPQNLDSLWDRRKSRLAVKGKDYSPLFDARSQIAEDRSPTGLAATTLDVLLSEDKFVPVHIILNRNTGEGLIVGESIPESIRAAFNKASITYVDRNSTTAKTEASKALAKLTQGATADVKQNLRAVFLRSSDYLRHDARSLPDILIEGVKYSYRNDVRCVFKKNTPKIPRFETSMD